MLIATKILFCQDLTFIRPLLHQSPYPMRITIPYFYNQKKRLSLLLKGQALNYEPCGTTQIGLQKDPLISCTSMHAP